MAGHIGGKPENFPFSSSPVRFGPMPQDPPAQWFDLFFSSSKILTSQAFIRLKKRKAVLSSFNLALFVIYEIDNQNKNSFVFFNVCDVQRSG